jgi:3'(2'), 5'-bisphosphate nucleotidase
MEWDIAAGHAIIESLGGRVVHAEKGHSLYYNKANLFNPYFIVETAAVKTTAEL